MKWLLVKSILTGHSIHGHLCSIFFHLHVVFQMTYLVKYELHILFEIVCTPPLCWFYFCNVWCFWCKVKKISSFAQSCVRDHFYISGFCSINSILSEQHGSSPSSCVKAHFMPVTSSPFSVQYPVVRASQVHHFVHACHTTSFILHLPLSHFPPLCFRLPFCLQFPH